MTTPTGDRRDLLTVVAHVRAASGMRDELRAALIEPTSQEKGYVNYDLHQSVEDPDKFFFYENWESAEALDAHLDTPHLRHFAAIMGDLLDDGGLTITRLRRIA